MTDTIAIKRSVIEDTIHALERYAVKRQDFERFESELAMLKAALAAPQPEPQPVKQAPIESFKELDYKVGWQRYEKVRKLNAHQFSELFQRGLKGERFDEMVDGLEAKT